MYLRNKQLLLLLLVILNIAIRVPVFPFELGVDSYYVHALSNAITKQGGLSWIGHPLMLLSFGGDTLTVPTLISALSQYFGIDGEQAILLLSILTGVTGALFAYILIKHVSGSDLLAFFSALIFSLSPEFLRLTIWTATTRALFIALLPFFLFLLFNIASDKKFKYIFFSVLIFLFLMATHNLIFLVPFCIISLIFAAAIEKYKSNIKIINKKYNIIFNLTLIFSWCLIFSLMFLMVVLKIGLFKNYPALWVSYQSGAFFEGEEAHVIILNLMVDYVSKIGILLPFAPFGLILLFKKSRNMFENYVLFLFLLFTPILTLGIYVPQFLLIAFAFLISIAIVNIIGTNVKLLVGKKIIISTILISTIFFSIFMMTNWGVWSEKYDDVRFMPQTKNTVSFMKDHISNGAFTSNERGGPIYKYSSLSGVVSAPAGDWAFPSLKSKKDYVLRINPDFISSFRGFGKPSNIIIFEEVNGNDNSGLGEVWYQFPKLWDRGLDEGKDIIDRYNIKYSVETNFGGYSVYYVKNMKFFKQVHADKPKIYDNRAEDIWFIDT